MAVLGCEDLGTGRPKGPYLGSPEWRREGLRNGKGQGDRCCIIPSGWGDAGVGRVSGIGGRRVQSRMRDAVWVKTSGSGWSLKGECPLLRVSLSGG